MVDSVQPSLVPAVPCRVKQIAIAVGTTREFVGARGRDCLDLREIHSRFEWPSICFRLAIMSIVMIDI